MAMLMIPSPDDICVCVCVCLCLTVSGAGAGTESDICFRSATETSNDENIAGNENGKLNVSKMNQIDIRSYAAKAKEHRIDAQHKVASADIAMRPIGEQSLGKGMFEEPDSFSLMCLYSL